MFLNIEGGKSAAFAVVARARKLVQEEPDKFRIYINGETQLRVSVEGILGNKEDDSQLSLQLLTTKDGKTREVVEQVYLKEEGDFGQDRRRVYRVDIRQGNTPAQELNTWKDADARGLLPHPEKVLGNYLVHPNDVVVGVTDFFTETNMPPAIALGLLGSLSVSEPPSNVSGGLSWSFFLERMGGFEALKRLVLPD